MNVKNFITNGEIDTITKLNAKLEEVKNDYLTKINDNDDKITTFNHWRDSVVAK